MKQGDVYLYYGAFERDRNKAEFLCITKPFLLQVRYLCNSLVFGKMTCHLSRFAQYSCAYVTVMSMAAISLDRHRVCAS